MKRITIVITTEWTVHGEPTEAELRRAAFRAASGILNYVANQTFWQHNPSPDNWSIIRDTLHVDLDTTKPQAEGSNE